jgi:uncharacterized membrane protein YccC
MNMAQQTQIALRARFDELIHFLLTRYVTDALRIALVIIVPACYFFKYGMPEAALGAGLGAILVSLLDYPGVSAEKNRAFHLSFVLLPAVALITSAALAYPLLLGLVIFGCCFGSALLMAYGARSGNVGAICTILMVFIMGLQPGNPLLFAGLITAGAVWAYLISCLDASVQRRSSGNW